MSRRRTYAVCGRARASACFAVSVHTQGKRLKERERDNKACIAKNEEEKEANTIPFLRPSQEEDPTKQRDDRQAEEVEEKTEREIYLLQTAASPSRFWELYSWLWALCLTDRVKLFRIVLV